MQAVDADALNALNAFEIEAEEAQKKMTKLRINHGIEFEDIKSSADGELKIDFERPKEKEPTFDWPLYHNPKISDFKQGNLGNCWMVASYAILILKPKLFGKIFIAKNPELGLYTLRLRIYGQWQEIIVDDLLPYASNNELIYAKRKQQLWAPIIEKALAKAFGNYNSLKEGFAHEGKIIFSVVKLLINFAFKNFKIKFILILNSEKSI